MCLLFVLWQSDHFWLRYSQLDIWPWKFKVKVMAKVKPDGPNLKPRVQSMCLLFVLWQSDHFWLRHSQFDIWPWKFKVKVMAKVKPDGPIWSLEFSQCVCFSFRGNRTIFGWDKANSIFDLENSRSRSWPRSNPMGIWSQEFSQCVCFSICGNRTIFGWDIVDSIFDLENSRSRSRQ